MLDVLKKLADGCPEPDGRAEMKDLIGKLECMLKENEGKTPLLVSLHVVYESEGQRVRSAGISFRSPVSLEATRALASDVYQFQCLIESQLYNMLDILEEGGLLEVDELGFAVIPTGKGGEA